MSEIMGKNPKSADELVQWDSQEGPEAHLPSTHQA